MSNLVCEGFHHVLLKYGHENAEMKKRKFDDVTLQYSMGFVAGTYSVFHKIHFLVARDMAAGIPN